MTEFVAKATAPWFLVTPKLCRGTTAAKRASGGYSLTGLHLEDGVHVDGRELAVLRFCDGRHSIDAIAHLATGVLDRTERPVTHDDIDAVLKRLRDLALLECPDLALQLAERGAWREAERVATQGLFQPAPPAAHMEPEEVEVRSDLRWRCVGCGACCSGRYRVELTEPDLAALRLLDLERELAIRHDDCIEAGIDVFGDPAVFLKQRAGRCVFLTSARRCGLHAAFGAEAKPHSCRAFPFLAVLTPHGATLRFRPECSGHHATFSSGPLVAPQRHEIWRHLAAGVDVLPAIPPTVPLHVGGSHVSYDRYFEAELAALRALREEKSWRQGLAVLAEWLGLGTASNQHALRTILCALPADAFELNLHRWIEPPIDPVAELERTVRAELRCAEHAGLPIPTEHDRVVGEYVANVLAGKFLFRGLSMASGVGLLGLVVHLARRTAALVADQYGRDVTKMLLNESLILWHQRLLADGPLRPWLLLRHVVDLEKGPWISGS